MVKKILHYFKLRQITVLRSTYFRSIVRQNIAYFDVNDTGEMNTRLFDDVKKIQDSIAEKVGVAIQENFSRYFCLHYKINFIF